MIPGALEHIGLELEDVLDDRGRMLLAYDHLGPIERQIVDRIVQRLGMGQAQYGVMKDRDSRDFREETAQEVLDGLVYICRLLHRPVAPQRDTDPAVDVGQPELEW